jgi:hypothetical protein
MAISTLSTIFANKGTVAVAGDGGTPVSETLYIVKDVEVTVSAEHVPLYGWGTIVRQAVARHSGKVGVRIGFAKFKPASGNWLFYINDPTTGTGNIIASSTGDTNTVKLFDITVTFKNESDETLTATIQNVYFPNFPMKAPEGQWIKVDLDGEGTGIAYT